MNFKDVKTAGVATRVAIVLLVLFALLFIFSNIGTGTVKGMLERWYLRNLKAKEDALDFQIKNAPLSRLDGLVDEIRKIHAKRLQFEREWGVTVSNEDAQELKAELEAEQRQKIQDEARAAESARLLKKCEDLDPKLWDPCTRIVLDMVMRSVLTHSSVPGQAQACLAMQNDPDLRRACVEEEKSE